MFISTVLLFVQDLLVTTFDGVLGKESIQITPNEQPWATSGEMTITIHPTGWDTGEVKQNQGAHAERVPFGVTVIQRSRKAPMDRWGQSLFLETTDSLSTISSIISKVLNKRSQSNLVLNTNYTNRVNTLSNLVLKNILLPSNKTSNVVGQFEWLDTQSEPVERMPEFFRETPKAISLENTLIAGHSITGFYASPTLMQAITCPS